MSRVTTYDVVDMSEYYQAICKHGPCLKRAVYEFTDLSNDGKLTIGVSGDDGNHMSVETSHVTIGYSCEHHVEEVNKLLKDIYET
jgi:hypothetical protein